MKWNKNQFGSRKVIRQATYLPTVHKKWAGPKSGPALPNRLRRRWYIQYKLVVSSPPRGVQCIAINISVQLHTWKITSKLHEIACVREAKARTSSDNNGTRYLLPVFWIRSRFRIMGTCGVWRGLWPRDVSQWQATPTKAES